MTEPTCPTAYVVILTEPNEPKMTDTVHMSRECAEQSLEDCGCDGYVVSRKLRK